MIFEKHLDYVCQINTIFKSCFFHPRNISRIKNTASLTILKPLIMLSLPASLNSLLFCLPSKVMKRLQLIQNCETRLIFNQREYSKLHFLAKQLHWLPVKFHIIYKIRIITHKALNCLAPVYNTDLLLLSLISCATLFLFSARIFLGSSG